MSIFKQKASNKGGNFEAPEAGAHPGVLVAIIDLGTHEKQGDKGNYKARSVFFAWELTTQAKAGVDENFTVGRDYTLSFGKKAALRKLVETLRGREMADDEEYDISTLLGKPFLLTLTHKTSGAGNTYAKIENVTGLPKAMGKPPAPKHKPFQWEFDKAKLGVIEAAGWLPYVYGTPVLEMIKSSDEYKGAPDLAAELDDGAEAFGDAHEGAEESSIPY